MKKAITKQFSKLKKYIIKNLEAMAFGSFITVIFLMFMILVFTLIDLLLSNQIINHETDKIFIEIIKK